MSPIYGDFFTLIFFSAGKDKTSVDLFLFLNFLFNFLIFLLFEIKIVYLTFFLINLYFLGNIFAKELKKNSGFLIFLLQRILSETTLILIIFLI